MLTYTLNRLLEQQRAVIERDVSATDRFGASGGEDWQTLGDPVPCRFYWRKQGSRGPAKEVSAAQRSVYMSEGGIIFAGGTDITDKDRVAEILDADGDLEIAGPFYIQAVFTYEGHIEVSWLSP